MGPAPAGTWQPTRNYYGTEAPRRDRLLAPGEIGALLKALATADETRTEAPQVVAVIRAAILTRARPSELLSLYWANMRCRVLAPAAVGGHAGGAGQHGTDAGFAVRVPLREIGNKPPRLQYR